MNMLIRTQCRNCSPLRIMHGCGDVYNYRIQTHFNLHIGIEMDKSDIIDILLMNKILLIVN